jgi:hypothetical protein
MIDERVGESTVPPPKALGTRGVSDVVGYVLVFALIVGTTLPILAVGSPALEDRRDRVHATGGERAVAAFDEQMGAIERSEAQQGETLMRLGGGELAVEPTTTVTVAAVDAAGRRIQTHVTRRVGSVVYRYDGAVSGYESGLRFRTDSVGSAPRDRPPIATLGGPANRTVVSVVVVRSAAEAAAIARSGTVRVRTSVVDRRRLELPAVAAHTAVRLRVESPRAEAWADALDAVDGVTVDESATTPTEVVATLDRDDDVSVRVIVVEVAVDSAVGGGPTIPPASTDVRLNTGDG